MLGLVGSLWFRRIATAMLYGVTASDEPTFAVMSMLLTLVSQAAVGVAASRVMRLDPVLAIAVNDRDLAALTCGHRG
jgi:hypothetical protein